VKKEALNKHLEPGAWPRMRLINARRKLLYIKTTSWSVNRGSKSDPKMGNSYEELPKTRTKDDSSNETAGGHGATRQHDGAPREGGP